ncbi:MAG: hypothetical protein ABI303_01065 [Candidatus Saccharimonas sp.]
MDIQQQSTQPINDDQELAKVLAGVNSEAEEVEAVPMAGDAQPPVAPMGPPVAAPVADDAFAQPAFAAVPTSPVSIPVAGELDGVKQAAITELRPLVDKLSLPPQEKFDTYLLLIRSTDDKSLIAPAHEAAKAITDETKRAQALLDVIKEIDFLSGQPV